MTSLNLHAGAAATIAALALAASAAAPTPASAGAPAPSRPAFALTPVGTSGALLMRGRPGRVLHGAVLVRNLSGHRITIKLQRADIRGASNGNADYGTTGLSRTGRWLKLAATTVRLNPHASRKVAYTVRVPVTARGASHYAGIVGVDAAELAVKTRKRKSFSFNRVTRQALPLTVRLPGPADAQPGAALARDQGGAGRRRPRPRPAARRHRAHRAGAGSSCACCAVPAPS